MNNVLFKQKVSNRRYLHGMKEGFTFNQACEKFSGKFTFKNFGGGAEQKRTKLSIELNDSQY